MNDNIFIITSKTMFLSFFSFMALFMDGVGFDGKRISIGCCEWIVLVGEFLLLFFLVWHDTWWLALCVTLGGFFGLIFVVALIGVIIDLIRRPRQTEEERENHYE